MSLREAIVDALSTVVLLLAWFLGVAVFFLGMLLMWYGAVAIHDAWTFLGGILVLALGIFICAFTANWGNP